MEFKIQIEISDADIKAFLNALGYKVECVEKTHSGAVNQEGEPIQLRGIQECAFKSDEDIASAAHYKDVFKDVLKTCVKPMVENIINITKKSTNKYG